MTLEIGTWVQVKAVQHMHGEIVGVIVGIPAHAADTMVTVRSHGFDYRGYPSVSDRWINRADIVATGPAAFESVSA